MSPILKLPQKYETIPVPELILIKAAMKDRIAVIEGQIERVMNMDDVPEEGFGSRKWFERAVKSRKKYEQDVERIRLMLEKTQEKQRQVPFAPPPGQYGNWQGHGTPLYYPHLEESFMKVARRRLDETVFKSIMNEAREEIQ